MIKTNIATLRAKTKEILSCLKRGEKIILMNRGAPFGEIHPIKSAQAKAVGKKKDESGVFGLWKDRDEMKTPAEYVRELRKDRYDR